MSNNSLPYKSNLRKDQIKALAENKGIKRECICCGNIFYTPKGIISNHCFNCSKNN